jgi:predicted protein tyrosine phosphatase
VKDSFAKKVLFICSRNRRRSLTAEKIFSGLPGFEFRSAGTQPGARIVVTAGLLAWADMILVMEKSHLNRLRERYDDVLSEKLIVALHIADEFEHMQPELIDELRAKVEPILEAAEP